MRIPTVIILFPMVTTLLNGKNLKVHFIDIAQGDAILIQHENKNYMIDAGRHWADIRLNSPPS